MTNPRSVLLDALARHAYRYSSDRPFLLSSGQYSDEYLDCKLALSHPDAMMAVGRLVLAALDPAVVAVGGLTMGSDPIAMSTSLVSHQSRTPVRWFAVRKEPKSHGQKKMLEGQVDPGEVVAIVDDVVTSGASTIRAIEACRDYGLRIAQVVALVDRQQSDGMANIQKAAGAGVSVQALFTKQQVKQRWMELQGAPPALDTSA